MAEPINYLSVDDFPEQKEEIIFKSDADFRRDLKEVAANRKEQKRMNQKRINNLKCCKVRFARIKQILHEQLYSKPLTRREKTTAQINRGFALADKWNQEQEKIEE